MDHVLECADVVSLIAGFSGAQPCGACVPAKERQQRDRWCQLPFVRFGLPAARGSDRSRPQYES